MVSVLATNFIKLINLELLLRKSNPRTEDQLIMSYSGNMNDIDTNYWSEGWHCLRQYYESYSSYMKFIL